VDSDGNCVNLGNFDATGLKVNNNWDDNRDGDLAVSSARHFHLFLLKHPPIQEGVCIND